MNVLIASAPAWPRARVCGLALATLLIAVGSPALAQAPAGQPLPKTQAKQPPQPKGAAAPQKPAEAQPQSGDAQQPQLQLVNTPWTKGCSKSQETGGQQVCFTGRQGFTEAGMPIVSAAVIEATGDPKKILRVTLPLGMRLAPGTRVVVDQGQPINAPYVLCFGNGCMADYEASDELIGKMKKGQGLAVMGIDGAGQPVTLVLPLADFAKAYDGQPTSPEEAQKRQQELQKRFDDYRKKMESQQQAAPAPAPPK